MIVAAGPKFFLLLGSVKQVTPALLDGLAVLAL
jgi:hypothetical protein